LHILTIKAKVQNTKLYNMRQATCLKDEVLNFQ
jgi:hypothetical protein